MIIKSREIDSQSHSSLSLSLMLFQSESLCGWADDDRERRPSVASFPFGKSKSPKMGTAYETEASNKLAMSCLRLRLARVR